MPKFFPFPPPIFARFSGELRSALPPVLQALYHAVRYYSRSMPGDKTSYANAPVIRPLVSIRNLGYATCAKNLANLCFSYGCLEVKASCEW